MEGDTRRRRGTLYRYRFGTAEFDEAAFTLRVGGVPAEVQRKPLEILALLLHHSGEVVTKDELLDTVWAGTHTVEAVITTSMNRLRKALGEDNAGRIVNQPRIGYRFDGAVERAAVGRSLVSTLDLKPGSKVPGRDNFVLDTLIGRSSGSEVWTARQAKSGEVRVYKFSADGERLAALKREVMLSRYLRESLGARNDIARILDWNFETPPFFLECEYGGQSLLEWAETDGRLRAMPLPARLDLFLQIADVVAAAHSVGVLHKDLKPGNVLVAPKQEGWQVRLTDFGSGRLLEPGRLEAMGITQLGLTMTQSFGGASSSGTPLYLAPELIVGQAPTQRSDVYALGLMLYQMIIGDFGKPLVSGWERGIADPLLRDDIAQATDGDPALRLDGAGELARRLRTLDARRLEQSSRDEAAAAAQIAIEAVKRNRARRPWVLATMAALGLGLAVSLTLYIQVRQSERALAGEFDLARTLYNFLIDDLIGAADPATTGRSNVTVAEAAKTAAGRIDETFKSGPPEIRAALHIEMQKTFMALTDYESALAEGQQALAVLKSEDSPDRQRLVDAQLTLADTLAQLSRLPEARDLLQSAERTLDDPTFAGSELQARLWLAKGALAKGSLAMPECLSATEKAWDLSRRVVDPSPNLLEIVELDLADAYRLSGRLTEAEASFRDLIARQTARFGANDVRPSYATAGLASVLANEERHDEARELLDKVIPVIERALGPDAHQTISAKNILAGVYFSQEKYDDAIRVWDEVAAAEARKMGEGSLHYLVTENDIGTARYHQGQIAVAEAIFRRALGLARSALAPTHPSVQLIRYNLAASLLDLHHGEQVPPLLDGLTPQALGMAQEEPDWEGRLAYQAGRLALQQGDRMSALASLTKAGEIIAAKNPDGFITPDMIGALIREASGGKEPGR
jgi:eukaryotic-like serine/threonine-protein kinase